MFWRHVVQLTTTRAACLVTVAEAGYHSDARRCSVWIAFIRRRGHVTKFNVALLPSAYPYSHNQRPHRQNDFDRRFFVYTTLNDVTAQANVGPETDTICCNPAGEFKNCLNASYLLFYNDDLFLADLIDFMWNERHFRIAALSRLGRWMEHKPSYPELEVKVNSQLFSF